MSHGLYLSRSSSPSVGWPPTKGAGRSTRLACPLRPRRNARPTWSVRRKWMAWGASAVRTAWQPALLARWASASGGSRESAALKAWAASVVSDDDIGGLKAKPDPPVLLGVGVPDQRNLLGAGVDVAMGPL